MAALEAATQRACVCGRKRVFSLADARWLGGRVKPGHGDFENRFSYPHPFD
jgi:hypothetical protein